MTQMIPDDRARQGASGRPVLGVLIGALALLAVAVASYMVWVGATSPDDPSQAASRELNTGSPSGTSNASNPNRISPENPAYPAPTDPSSTGTTAPKGTTAQ